jgi:CelD/BcsL family acetyltransferase involved in cellulose biosynthesis
METKLSVDLLKPSALSRSERATWQAMQAASPALRSPYFRLEYALAATASRPAPRVAVIHRGGRVEGFLPFQKRGDVAQP